MTVRRKGRPPEGPERKADAAAADKACAETATALDRGSIDEAANILLRTARRIVKHDTKLRGGAGYGELGKHATLIARACNWAGKPPPDALIDLMVMLLGDAAVPDSASKDSTNAAKRRALIAYLTDVPDPKRVTPQEAAKAAEITWHTAKKWLADPDIQNLVTERRIRRSDPSWARKAHYAERDALRQARDARAEARKNGEGCDPRTPDKETIAVARAALRPKKC